MSDPGTPAAPAAAHGRPGAPPSVHPAWPLAAVALSALLFIGMDTLVKLLAPRFDAVQLTFVRFVSGSVFAVALWAWFRTPLPTRANWPLHGLRALLLLAALVSWFYAIKHLPLVQAVAVGYMAPIFIALLAMLVLRERPSRWVGVALALGALGVGVGLWPELQASAAPGSAQRVKGMLAAALSAVCYAGVIVLARHQAQRDALWTIMLVQNLLPTLLLAAPAALVWQPMQAVDLLPVAAIGLLATGGLMALTWAFARVEASRAAPMEYTGLLWAGLLGWFVFGEQPGAAQLASAGLIVLGALLLLRR